MKCKLVDVFANQKFTGNGLTIFSEFESLSADQMLLLTQEMRQFESIFLSCSEGNFSARIFTMEEELDFAGHPLLGLAYHLHEQFGEQKEQHWDVQLNKKSVKLSSRWHGNDFFATMDQGKPDFLKILSHDESVVIYTALGLKAPLNLSASAEVVSTGLPYLILPVIGDLEHIQFSVSDLTDLLIPHGAQFLYVLDIDNYEGRTWDNSGKVEDIATGSAAGPAAAYLFKNDLLQNKEVTIKQGRFVGRSSEIFVSLSVYNSEISSVHVSGHVVKVADIILVD